tara:strand:+ start:218 stop:520 length:303 start_codon:yes stop_codon:yes gene_type:complete
MWDYWFEAIVLAFLVGIYARLWFAIREIACMHEALHDIHDHVFMQTGEVQVRDGENFHVMELEEFMDRFGFDPRQNEETPDTEDKKASASEIDAWDNAKV